MLAALLKLGMMPNVMALSGGTDGEDGPTDAAGEIADQTTLERAASLGLDGADLRRNDAVSFFSSDRRPVHHGVDADECDGCADCLGRLTKRVHARPLNGLSFMRSLSQR